jgi:hypothetical protein
MTEGICMPTIQQASLKSILGEHTYIHIWHSMSNNLIDPSALNKRAAEHAIKSDLTHTSFALQLRDFGPSLSGSCQFAEKFANQPGYSGTQTQSPL